MSNPFIKSLTLEQESKSFKIDDKTSICIRRHTLKDVNSIFLTYNRNLKFLHRFILHEMKTYSLADSKFWVENCIKNWNEGISYEFLIINEVNSQIIGSCSINDINFVHRFANIGAWVIPNKIGKDVLDIAVAYMCFLALEVMQLVRAEFIIDVTNAAHSHRIVRRIVENKACVFEGTLRNRLSVRDKAHNAHLYSVIQEDIWFYAGVLAMYPKNSKTIQILEFEQDTPIGFAGSLLPNYKIFNISNIQDIDYKQPLILLGSIHSVNENTTWVLQALELTQKAIENNTPILGICFGAQLIAKVLGQEIYKIPSAEYGWYEISPNVHVFHWHNEGFNIPDKAQALFSENKSYHCNAYRYNNIIAAQFHFEVSEKEIYSWINETKEHIDREKILADTAKFLLKQHELAKYIVKEWLVSILKN